MNEFIIHGVVSRIYNAFRGDKDKGVLSLHDYLVGKGLKGLYSLKFGQPVQTTGDQRNAGVYIDGDNAYSYDPDNGQTYLYVIAELILGESVTDDQNIYKYADALKKFAERIRVGFTISTVVISFARYSEAKVPRFGMRFEVQLEPETDINWLKEKDDVLDREIEELVLFDE